MPRYKKTRDVREENTMNIPETSPNRKETTLVLKLKCKARFDARGMKMNFIEDMKHFGYEKKDWSFTNGNIL